EERIALRDRRGAECRGRRGNGPGRLEHPQPQGLSEDGVVLVRDRHQGERELVHAVVEATGWAGDEGPIREAGQQGLREDDPGLRGLAPRLHWNARAAPSGAARLLV